VGTDRAVHIMINRIRRAASLIGFAATLLMGSFAGAQAGIPTTALRYFNTYGPNQTFTPYVAR